MQEFLRWLPPDELDKFRYQWREYIARDEQLAPPGTWLVWLALAGRGFGKTRAGCEWVRERVESGVGRYIGIIGRTAEEARKVLIEGPAGLLAVSPPEMRPDWKPGNKELLWPNGAKGYVYSADRPDQLRGPQHDTVLGDELAAWRYPEAWDMAMFGLRMGNDPRAAALTTPRPITIIKDLLADPETHITRGSTYANADNLPHRFLQHLLRKYEGTRLGRQELHAEVLDDTPGALWTRAMIERGRLRHDAALPQFERVVVAIDPSLTSGENSDEVGIVAVAKDGRSPAHGYVLEDASARYDPDTWGKKAIELYHRYKADRIVAEINVGGNMVEHTLRVIDPNVAYRAVHAKRGKYVRAEPAAALYEQSRVHHLGMFAELEDQMCHFVPDLERKPGDSPDRADALVYALTDLLVEPMAGAGLYEYYRQRAAEIEAKKVPPPPPERTYAPGSLEWAAQQDALEAAKRDKDGS